MRKKFKLCIFLFLTFLFSFAIACGSTKTQLVGWENTADTVEYGAEYKLREYVYDNKGNAHNVFASVTFGDKDITVLNNSFTVNETGIYLITYSTNATLQTVTTTLSVTKRIDSDFVLSSQSDGEVLSDEQVEALNFQGNYQGAVHKYDFNPTVNSTKNLSFNYSYDDFSTYKAQGYSKLVFFVAIESSSNKAVRLLCSETTNKNGLIKQDFVPSFNKWLKIKIDIDEAQTVLFTDGLLNNGIQLFSAYTSTDKRYDENGQISNATIYITDILFDESTRDFPVANNEILFVYNEKSLDNYNFIVGQGNSSKSLATNDELDTLSGDYNGNAVKFTAYSDYSRLFITPRITVQDWDNAVNNGYQNFYFYVAYDEVKGTNIQMNIRGEDSLHDKSVNLEKGVWRKFLIPLNDSNKELLFHEDGAKMFLAYRYEGKKDENNNLLFALYVGDCGFDEDSKFVPAQEGEILFVSDRNTTDGFKNVAETGNPEKATQSDLSTLTGDYTGNAIKIVTKSHVVLVAIVPKITESDWDKAIQNGYAKMYIWVAATVDDETAKVNMQQMAEDNSLIGNGCALELGVWTKLTFELSNENKEILFSDNGGRITRFYRWNESGITNMVTYIGNCGFEK